MVDKKIPPIKTLFQDSWKAMVGSLFNLFILWAISAGISFLVFGIILGLFGGLAVIGSLAEAGKFQSLQWTSLADKLTPQLLKTVGVGFIIGVVAVSIIIKALQLAVIYTLGNYKNKPRLGECFRAGLRFFFPVFVVGLLASLIKFGGWMFFLVPGLLMWLFFMFFDYEIIFGGKKWLNALWGSYRIISQNFGEIFIRMLIPWVGYLLIWLPFNSIRARFNVMVDKAPNEALSGYIGIIFLEFLLFIVINWFLLAYGVVLYQQAKAVTDENEQPKTGWIWITSILGWLIAIIIGLGVVKLIKLPAVQTKISQIKQELIGGKLSEDKQLEQWRASIKSEARPYWDESVELFKKINENAENPAEVKKLNDANITALQKAAELDPENPVIWSELCHAQTWVSTKGSLENGLKACQKAEELGSEILTFQYDTGDMLVRLAKWDEAVLQLEKVLRSHENYGLAHYSLGIAYKNLGMDDSAKQHLSKAIEIWETWSKNNNNDSRWDTYILLAKKELETVGKVQVKSTSSGSQPAAPSCTRYSIREGEFKSDKCYVKKDYDDLMYYLQRFNAAAGAYNGAVASMQITCSGSDFFKNQCEQDKKTKADAEANINNYRNIINGIIARGR